MSTRHSFCFFVFSLSLSLACSAQKICQLPTPLLSAGIITCSQPSTQLHLAVLPYNVDIEWYGLNLQANQVASPLVSEPGWYFVKITERNTQCTRLDSVFVQAKQDIPIVRSQIFIQRSVENYGAFLLTGEGSSVGREFLYTWTSDNPNIEIDNDMNINTFSFQPSIFTLRVTNTLTGCAAESTCSSWDLEKFVEK